MQHEERVSFVNSRGQTLAGILHRPAAERVPAAVILCHGMESNKESEKATILGRSFAERGILALRFDFAGAGESGGTLEDITYSGEVADLRAAFDFILQYNPEKIGILGSSMGGAVALLFAAEKRKVDCLVTIAAPVHPEKITGSLLSQEEVTRWRESGFIMYHDRKINRTLLDDLERINVPAAARKISCPVLIIHGDADQTVPINEAHELHSLLSCAKKILIFNGADHRLSDPCLMGKALDAATDWMLLHLEGDGHETIRA
ncbi:MAG: alpha/beta fold hydrolase [Deltaproteobacteria bacterium]|nr:alpha/beta fold hydrolase [Deltaproteobacteria bacterium]